MSVEDNSALTIQDTPLFDWLMNKGVLKEYIFFDLINEWLQSLGYSSDTHKCSQHLLDVSAFVIEQVANNNNAIFLFSRKKHLH